MRVRAILQLPRRRRTQRQLQDRIAGQPALAS